MSFGFDITNNIIESPPKKVKEPVNFVDGENPPDNASGNDNTERINDPVPPDTSNWTNEDYIPHIELARDAKNKYLDSLPNKQKNQFVYLGFGVLIYYLFS